MIIRFYTRGFSLVLSRIFFSVCFCLSKSWTCVSVEVAECVFFSEDESGFVESTELAELLKGFGISPPLHSSRNVTDFNKNGVAAVTSPLKWFALMPFRPVHARTFA